MKSQIQLPNILFLKINTLFKKNKKLILYKIKKIKKQLTFKLSQIQIWLKEIFFLKMFKLLLTIKDSNF